MRYDTAIAFRMALESTLNAQSRGLQLSIDRARRRVLFESLMRRLDQHDPGRWVVKGGMALEVRLRERARRTTDIDLGLRLNKVDPAVLRDQIIDALAPDRDGDFFSFEVGEAQRLAADSSGQVTWRFLVTGSLAGRVFAKVKLDVSPRPHELHAVDRIPLRSLSFADVPDYAVEVVEVHRHLGEKFHALTRPRTGPNSRVRDLVDVVLLFESGLVDPGRAALATIEVFGECATHEIPTFLADPPSSWHDEYEAMANDLDLQANTFSTAFSVARALWARMFPTIREDS
jgi:Nucleotidyl transferase AbiEii toxin, Type IV TA system